VQYQLWKMIGRTRQAVGIDRSADETGASLVEYALLVALIAVVCIIAVSLLGGAASTKFSEMGSALQ